MAPSPLRHVRAALNPRMRTSGRASREEFLWGLGAALTLLPVACLLDGATGMPLATLAWMAGAALPVLATAVRRLHDAGRSGWWLPLPQLLLAGAMLATHLVDPGALHDGVPMSGLVLFVASSGLLVAWLASAGDAGPNRFGPVPPDGNGPDGAALAPAA